MAETGTIARDTPRGAEAAAAGALILVVGPSGAGKDTLIEGVKRHFAGNPRLVFPRRLVTRASGAAEDHDTLDEADYAAGIAAGRFAVHWRAHGLGYALPRSVAEDVAAGRVVLFNASRAVVPLLREAFPTVVVVGIDAPVAVRAARLAGRGRESAEEIAARLARTVDAPVSYDHVIVNDGPPERAIARLAAIVGAALGLS